VGFVGLCRLDDWQRIKPYGIGDIAVKQRMQTLPMVKLLSYASSKAKEFTHIPNRYAASTCTL